MLNDLQVECKNKEVGCPEVSKYYLLRAHEKQCQYEVLLCTNSGNGCIFEDLRLKVQEHTKTCEFGKIDCECGAYIIKKEKQSHNCIKTIRENLDKQENKLATTEQKLEESEKERKLLKDKMRENEHTILQLISIPEIRNMIRKTYSLGGFNSHLISELNLPDYRGYLLDSGERSEKFLEKIIHKQHFRLRESTINTVKVAYAF
jgi:hypothetical protein